MKLLKVLKTSIPFIIVFAVICALIFYPQEDEPKAAEKRIVTVWNVDTFEGGKGSRTAFLGRVARKAEKKSGEVYYFVTSYSIEGANTALAAGNVPDILSFGVGLAGFMERSVPLDRSFVGGATSEGCLAYPWCGGGYALYSLNNNFDEEGITAISVGGNNLPCVAAAYAGIKGEEIASEAAYIGFLSGKYRYLLGTQRDACRFQARGVTVYSKSLTEYCDLYQYISVLSPEKREDCFLFLDVLFSDEIQGALSDIGMQQLKAMEASRTVNVFTSLEALTEIASEARCGGDLKNLEKFLKKV